MKKTKTMVVVALAIVLTLSIGYALFSQTINITGTATASGSFEFTPTCTIGIDPGIIPSGSNAAAVETAIMTNHNSYVTTSGMTPHHPTADAGSSNNSCTVSGNNVSMATTLAYPGAMQTFTVKITNTGTISGRVDPTNYLIDSIRTGSGPTGIYTVALYIDGVNVIPADYANVQSLLPQYTNHEYAPGDDIYLVYSMFWPQDDHTTCNGGSECTKTFSYSYTFEQYNQ